MPLNMILPLLSYSCVFVHGRLIVKGRAIGVRTKEYIFMNVGETKTNYNYSHNDNFYILLFTTFNSSIVTLIKRWLPSNPQVPSLSLIY